MRPTGALHLGNYLGALKNWTELQYQYECYFFVADIHALTTGYDDTVGSRRQHLGDGDRLAGGRTESGERDACSFNHAYLSIPSCICCCR